MSYDPKSCCADEMENYRLALAWISKQSSDPHSRELAETALKHFEIEMSDNQNIRRAKELCAGAGERP